MFADKITNDLLSNNSFQENYANYFGQDYASNPSRILFLNNQSFCKTFVFFLNLSYFFINLAETYDLTYLLQFPKIFLSSLTGNEITDVLNFVVVDQFNQTVKLNFSM